jgi:hypothetical protein
MSRAAIVLLWLAAASAARAELLSERWAGKDTPATHAGTLVVAGGKTPRLVFDLSALPKGAKVHHASLVCFTQGGRQPKQPAVLRMAQELDAEGNAVPAGRPFELEPPWFRSFDVTQAVAAWSKDPAGNLGFAVVSFDQLLPAKSCLDVLYEGPSPGKTPPQIRGVRAVHHDGQTFILWQEHPAFVPRTQDVVWVDELCLTGDKLAGGPGKTARGLERTAAVTLKTLRGLQGLKGRWQPSGFQGIKPLEREKEVPAVRYRVYRHTERITAANLPQAERIAEVEPLSAYDDGMARIAFQGEFIDQRELPDSVIATYCYADNRQVPPGECLYVHTCREGGRFYYAVTDALAGTENACEIGGENSLAEAVEESVAPPRPVLQFIQENAHHKGVPEYWFRYWAGPPYYHLPSRMFRIAASVPPKYKAPGPLELESIHDTWNVREKILVPPEAAIRLLAEPIHGYMPDLCYNEGEGTLRAAAESKVDYFAERFMANLIQWAIRRWDVDRTKISGGMMHFGLRHPEIFSVMSFGTYTATYDYRWAPGSQSLPGLLGPKGIKTVTGEDAWSEFSAGWYVNRHPDRDIPFLICQSNVGKDVGHTSEFGWQDDPRGWGELNRARATYVASWSTDFSREFHEGLRRVDWTKTLPAFSRGSLDNNPGNGDPADGDYYGTINGWLLWGSDSVDEPGRWAMTVYVIPSCIRDDCTVDITPRHCKAFKAKPGEKFRYSNASLADGSVVQSGELAADRWGLLTISQARVSKGKNRISIDRGPNER